MNWLARAKLVFSDTGNKGTDNTDERNPTSVLAVPVAHIGQNGSTCQGVLATANTAERNPTAVLAVPNRLPGAGRLVSNVGFGSADAGMSQAEESRILAWLAHIEETDQAAIDHVLACCRASLRERAGILRLADIALPKPRAGIDEPRTCRQCVNLTPRGVCLAARRGEIKASPNYQPVPDVLMRCEAYAGS